MPKIAAISLIQLPPSNTSVTTTADERRKFDAFIKAVNIDIEKLNQYIEAFNQADTPETQQKHLRNLYEYRQSMNHKYRRDQISLCKSYQEQIQDRLWTDIKRELNNLGRTSTTFSTETSADANTTPAEIFSNMPHDKLTKLMKIFWENKNVEQKLEALYAIDEPGGTEFHQFLNTHCIQVLSGNGNSRNIKIGPNVWDSDEPELILKVDVRLGQPKEQEQKLRDGGFQHLGQIHSEERQATFESGGVAITADLFLTDFYDKGDLLYQSTKTRNYGGLDKLISSAADYYQQMATILLEMEAMGVAFPDAKNTNWLIDSDHRLKISDTKSFLACSPLTATIDRNDPQNKQIALVRSSHLRPDDFDRSVFSADKMHGYMLGKNLYQFLTSRKSEDMLDITSTATSTYSFKDEDFKHPIFQTDEGLQMKVLIQHLVQPKPEDRISLAIALEQLNDTILKLKIRDLYAQIQKQIPEAIPLVDQYAQVVMSMVDNNEMQKQQLILDKFQKVIDLSERRESCNRILDRLKSHLPNPETIEEYNVRIKNAYETHDLAAMESIDEELNRYCDNVCHSIKKEYEALRSRVSGVLAQETVSDLNEAFDYHFECRNINSLQDVIEYIIGGVFDKCVNLCEKNNLSLDDPLRKQLAEENRETFTVKNVGTLLAIIEKLAPAQEVKKFEEFKKRFQESTHSESVEENLRSGPK